MDTTINTGAELLKQIGYIADDENSMKKLLKYVKKLVIKKNERDLIEKKEALDDFRQSLEELKAYKEGKTDFMSLEEFRDELRQEGYYD